MRSGSASRWYLLVWGFALVVLGVGSLVVHPDFHTGSHVTAERLFGEFETNGWHGLGGLSLGVLALWSAWAGRAVTGVTVVVAVVGGVVPAIVFLVSGDGSAALGVVPVDSADAVMLHLVPGLVGLGCVAADRAYEHTRVVKRA